MSIDWKRKLTSRKFWMAVAGFVSGLMIALGRAESEAATVGGLILQGAAILAYCIGEGLADGGNGGYLPYDEPVDPPVQEVQPQEDGWDAVEV